MLLFLVTNQAVSFAELFPAMMGFVLCVLIGGFLSGSFANNPGRGLSMSLYSVAGLFLAFGTFAILITIVGLLVLIRIPDPRVLWEKTLLLISKTLSNVRIHSPIFEEYQLN